eukprot:gene15251-15398_t
MPRHETIVASRQAPGARDEGRPMTETLRQTEDAIRIVQVSDCHLSRSHGYFYANWPVFMDEMRADPPALIVNSGDLSFNGPDAEDDLAFARIQHDLLPVPWRAIAGNHDTGEAPSASRLNQPINAERLARWQRHIGPSWWLQDIGAWRLIGLETALLGSALPEEAAQATFFTEALASREGRPVLVFVHIPPFAGDPEDAAFTTASMPLEPRRRFLETCVASGVKMIACGHVHTYRRQRYRGIPIICAPGTAFVSVPRKRPRGWVMPRAGYLEWTLSGRRIQHRLVEPKLFITHETSNWTATEKSTTTRFRRLPIVAGPDQSRSVDLGHGARRHPMCIACGPLMDAFTSSLSNASRRSFLKRGGMATIAAGGFGGPVSRLVCTEAMAQTAAGDTLYTGGPVLTMTDTAPVVEAVLVRAGMIVAVGTRADVEKQARAPVAVVDLGGKALLPGFFDAHGHVVMVGLQSLSANLLPAPDGQVNDIPALQRMLREWMPKNAQNIARYNLIMGFGYDDSQLHESRHPTRDELDAVSTDVPVIAIHQSGHLCTVNSKALEIAKIGPATKDPAGGVFRRRAGGSEPNGVCEEAAFFQILGVLLSRLDEPAFLAMIKAGAEFCASFGYTTVQEGRANPITTAVLKKAASQDLLPVDILVFPDILDSADVIVPTAQYTKRLRIGGAKLTIDGSPQGKTAWLTKPYHVPPEGQKASYAGYPAITKEQTDKAIDLAYAKNWQILVHANGDAAIDSFIDSVRKSERKHGKGDRRPVLIHGQTTRADQLPDIKQLGILPSFFPMHTFYWGDWHRDSVLGPVRAETISPCASARKLGMTFTSHHDAPVANPDSIRVLSATVTRRTRSGDILGPNERVDTQTALKAMTIWAARQHFEEASKGSIEVGKIADFVVLDKNPLSVDNNLPV